MLIDWFTVIAQGINFLILVWLLKKFLYKPVLNAIHEREEKIKNEIESANEKKKNADEQMERYDKKHDEIIQQKEEILKAAQEDANEEKKKLMQSAREEYEKLKNQLQSTLNKEENNIRKSIIHYSGIEVMETSKKMIRELADASLEERMIDKFIQRLKDSDENKKGELKNAYYSSSPAEVKLLSSFEFLEEKKNELNDFLNRTFEADVHLNYLSDPDQISGLSLEINYYKISWNVKDYLSNLESNISTMIRKHKESSGGSNAHEEQ